MCVAFLFGSIVAYSQNPFENMTLSIDGNEFHSACPEDPLLFRLDNITPADPASTYRFEWSVSADSSTWKMVDNIEKVLTYSVTMGDADFYIKVKATKVLHDGRISAENSLGMKILLSSNCKECMCHQTTTGDYFNGTDFNHNGSINWGTKPPENLEELFSDQGIIFSAKQGDVENQRELGYPLYIDDSLGVNPNNNFYVKQGVNDNLSSDVSKVYIEESLDHKKAIVRVTEGARMSDSFHPDKYYKLELSAYKLINGNMSTYPECTDTMTLWIYDQPNTSTVNLYAGDNCSAVWNLPLDSVPTATISYFKEVRYLYDNCDGRSYNYDELGLSTALSTTYDTVGYPFMVRRISNLDEQWKTTSTSVVTEFKNAYTASDSVVVKIAQHKRDDRSVCQEDDHERMAVKLTNFTELPTCITNPFTIGCHEIVWYYDNGKGVIDSCVTKIVVTDSTPPIFTSCDNMTDIVINLDMKESFASLDKVKTALGTHTATDNCNGEIQGVPQLLLPDSTLTPLPASFKKDTTFVIAWVFEDNSGNKTECYQNLTVDQLTKLNEGEAASSLTVYPNPVQNTLWIEATNGHDDQTVQILDIAGMIVAEYNLAGSAMSINVSGLPQGMYMLCIGTQITKLIKQ